MNRYILTLLIILGSAGAAFAQVNKQVEVTREYIPQIVQAQKPSLAANMLDTVRIHPEIDYAVTPLSITTSLESIPIKAATITYWEFNRPKRFYVKAGGGYQWNSLLDVYASTHDAGIGYALGYLNHNGMYGDVNNINASRTNNEIGGAAGTYFGSKLLEVKADYGYDGYHRYASNHESGSSALRYQDVNLGVRFGDDFLDLSHVNFDIKAKVQHLWSSASTRSTTASTEVLFGRNIAKGLAEVKLLYDYAGGNYDFSNHIAGANLLYDMDYKSLQITFGADYYFDRVVTSLNADNHHYFIPNLTLRYAKWSNFTPYLELSGGLKRNNYAALVLENPYIGADIYATPTVKQDFNIGVSGVLANNKLYYTLYGCYGVNLNNLYWTLVYDEVNSKVVNNKYVVKSADQHNLSVNLELTYSPIADLNIEASVHGYKYYDTDMLYSGKAPLKSYLGADYRFRKLQLGIGADLLGCREFAVNTYLSDNVTSIESSVVIPAAVNLKAFAEWTLNPNMSIYLNGENLCNAKLYEWAGYQGFGITISGGVKMQF